jgi:hypothetical protein
MMQAVILSVTKIDKHGAANNLLQQTSYSAGELHPQLSPTTC